MTTIDSNKKIQKTRTEKEMRKALSNLIHRRHTMCIPPQIDDDDIVLYDVFRELEEARAKLQAVYNIAETALRIGGTWDESERTGMLTEGLADIVKLCQELPDPERPQ